MHDAYAANPLLGIGKTLAASFVAMVQITQKFLLPIAAVALIRWALF